MLLRSYIDGAEIEKIGIRVVTVDFEDFGDESAARPSFDVDDDVERVADVCFNRANAKVRPDTTIATKERPRAIVLVNACCRTLTAFSQGEAPWPKAGAANNRPRAVTVNCRNAFLNRRDWLQRGLI